MCSYFSAAVSRLLLFLSVSSCFTDLIALAGHASTQALHVLPLLLFAQAIQMLVHLIGSGKFLGWLQFIESVVAIVLWPLFTSLLLAPQRRAVDRDHTRPI
jgi:cell shape-determining protein MreD